MKFHTHKSLLEEDYNPRPACPEKPSSVSRREDYLETFGKQPNRKNQLSIDTGEVRNLIAEDVLNSSSCTSLIHGLNTHKKSHENIQLHELQLNTSGLRYDSENGFTSPLRVSELRKKSTVSPLSIRMK